MLIADYKEFLSPRVINCLKNDGIVTVDDFLNKTDIELIRIPNFGPKSLEEARSIIGQPLDNLSIEKPVPHTDKMVFALNRIADALEVIADKICRA